jgi:hypothetical protein
MVEFSARVQNGHDDFRGAHASGVHAHGNAASVVLHRNRTVEVHGHVDIAAMPSEMFVDAVVDRFPDEMVQP